MTENLSPSLSPPDRNDETVFARLEAELSAFPLPEDRGDAIPFPPKAKEGAGIGELSEKSIHQMLKCCYAPDPTQREVKIGRFVADVYDGRRVAEIQTGTAGTAFAETALFSVGGTAGNGSLSHGGNQAPSLDRSGNGGNHKTPEKR